MSARAKLDNAIARNGAPLWGRAAPTGFSVGFDWDDVVMPWYDRAVEVCRDAGICPAGLEPRTWAQHEEMGCTLDEWIAALDAATESGVLYDTQPFPGAVEAMRRLYFEGHWIHIVTARGTFHGNRWNERIHEITREQVEEWAVPHHSLTFTRDKASVPTDFFIDDNLRNYHALDSAGVEVYLLNRPWNAVDETKIDTLGLRRVNTVDEFVDIILQEAA